jgi:hypothetical protein
MNGFTVPQNLNRYAVPVCGSSFLYSETLSNLLSNTTYYYRFVYDFNTCADSGPLPVCLPMPLVKGNTLFFTTLAQDYHDYKQVVTLPATNIASNSATLSGTVPLFGGFNSGFTRNISFLYSDSEKTLDRNPQVILATTTNGISYSANVINLSPKTRYYFRIALMSSPTCLPNQNCIHVAPSQILGNTLYFDTISSVIRNKDRFNKNLYYGIQNDDQVRMMQQILISLNMLHRPSDGNFDIFTFEAVKMFQREYKLRPVDGFVGRHTRKVLNDFKVPSPQPINPVLQSLYNKNKDGQISECTYLDSKYYTVSSNVYDGGGAIFDNNGKIVGNCNGMTGVCTGIIPQNCERVYVVYPNIWGFPAVNKYNLQ